MPDDITDPCWYWQDGRVFAEYRGMTLTLARLNNHGREIVYSYYITCPEYYTVVGPLYPTAHAALIAANVRARAHLTKKEQRPDGA